MFYQTMSKTAKVLRILNMHSRICLAFHVLVSCVIYINFRGFCFQWTISCNCQYLIFICLYHPFRSVKKNIYHFVIQTKIVMRRCRHAGPSVRHPDLATNPLILWNSQQGRLATKGRQIQHMLMFWRGIEVKQISLGSGRGMYRDVWGVSSIV